MEFKRIAQNFITMDDTELKRLVEVLEYVSNVGVHNGDDGMAMQADELLKGLH